MLGLLTDMWMYLAGAAIIGLIIGWAFRGAFLPRPKTVSVAQSLPPAPIIAEFTEEQKQALERAEQAEAVISALEGRVKTAQEAAATAQGEVTALKASLKYAEEQLAAAPAGKPPTGGTLAVASAIGAASLTPAAKDSYDNDPKLEWQKRYLEARVRHLEAQHSDTPASAAAPAVDTSGLEAELAQLKSSAEEMQARLTTALGEQSALQAKLHEAQTATEPKTEATISLGDFSKVQWQNRYLKARLLHVEEKGTVANDDFSPVSSPDTSYEVQSLKSEITVLKAELDRVSGADTQAEKELASLRWRNRYLEGRLKYLEAASLDAASDADDRTDGVGAALSGIAAPVVAPTVEKPEPDPIKELVEEVIANIEPKNEVRPLSLDAPRGGQPDDLQRIGGVGPKIEGILNELGIFHFDQIAAWTDEEASWIDSYLRFQGRVQREKWVDQAASLEKAKSTPAE